VTLGALLGSIPSPGSKAIEVGPLSLRAYGLMIALGVLAAVELGRRRFAPTTSPPSPSGRSPPG